MSSEGDLPRPRHPRPRHNATSLTNRAPDPGARGHRLTPTETTRAASNGHKPAGDTRRLPRHDAAERNLLGAAINQRRALEILALRVSPDHFDRPSHKLIAEVLIDAFHAGWKVDHVVVNAELERRGYLELAGGVNYIVGLYNSSGSNAERYAGYVVEFSEARRLVHLAARLDELARNVDLDGAQAVIEEAMAISGTSTIRAVRLGDTFETYFDILEARQTGNPDMLGIPTGWTDLDAILGGLRAGQLITIAARPSVGKSALAVGLAMHTAAAGFATLVVSLEMGLEELQDRYLAASTGLDSRVLRNGQWGMVDWQRIGDHLGKLSPLPLYVYDAPEANVQTIHAAARSVPDVALVIVDYLQLVTGPNRKAESRQAEVAEVSRGLKMGVARHVGAPVVALAQLNRSVELRSDKRPMLSDLRESGAIENDSDVVIGLYRDELYHPDTEDKDVIELNVLKQRSGPLGMVKLGYQKHLHRMTNLAKEF